MENTERNIFEVTEEDMNLSFEGITQVEKRFLNAVRNFRGQRWLQTQVAEIFETTVGELLDTSINNIAIQTLADEIRQGLKDEEVTDTFDDIKLSVENTEELMEEISDEWEKQVKETIYGELTPMAEDEINSFKKDKELDK